MTRCYCLVRSFLIWIYFLLPYNVHGYASWLKCYVELDPTEVIMHHYVMPADDSTEVAIEVQEYGESKSWMSEYFTSTQSNSNSEESVELMLKVRLSYPLNAQNLDIQYVMEVSEGDAEFIDRGVMCDGTRAFSRNQDHLVLQIKDTSKPIQVVAGYAFGMEAVRLTHAFAINNGIGSDGGNENNEEL